MLVENGCFNIALNKQTTGTVLLRECNHNDFRLWPMFRKIMQNTNSEVPRKLNFQFTENLFAVILQPEPSFFIKF